MNAATITCSPPTRETPGFGCPGCSAPLNFRDRQGIARGRMACCGYVPTAQESARWLKAADALDSLGPTCGCSSDEKTGD